MWYDTFYRRLSNLLPLKDFNYFTFRRVKQIFDHFKYIYSLFWLVLYILRWLLNLNMLATLYSSLFTKKNKDLPSSNKSLHTNFIPLKLSTYFKIVIKTFNGWMKPLWLMLLCSWRCLCSYCGIRDYTL